ncbi:Cytochrome P450 [Penicillium coprophilum]|uniref:Cytochrome P450 n=1 Tax=Penicillium coprophilum TaxID=36646 RepID=UPI0023999EB5|nr:Cytochrome P450 [Penicillium coprophilum]KAJ5170895.1 Cytochrome P450 [Penicillium coprophilum]
MSALAPSVALGISIFLVALWIKSHQPHSTSNDPAICRQIIARALRSKENQSNILSAHEAKVIANLHLPIAFGIAFTGADSIYASMFVEKLNPLINLSTEQWYNVSEFARVTINHWTEHGFPGVDVSSSNSSLKERKKAHGTKIGLDCNRINVASLAQILSLKLVLWQIFDEKSQDWACDENLLNLAQSINRAWISYKLIPAENNISRFEGDVLRQTSLAIIFGKHDRPENNPLNLILPSFKTMW